MKLFLYARKSSESEDRQVQSIEDQKYRLRELALRSGTIIHRDIYQESKSAKEPNAMVISFLLFSYYSQFMSKIG